jgi:hypothetical protein
MEALMGGKIGPITGAGMVERFSPLRVPVIRVSSLADRGLGVICSHSPLKLGQGGIHLSEST